MSEVLANGAVIDTLGQCSLRPWQQMIAGLCHHGSQPTACRRMILRLRKVASAVPVVAVPAVVEAVLHTVQHHCPLAHHLAAAVQRTTHSWPEMRIRVSVHTWRTALLSSTRTRLANAVLSNGGFSQFTMVTGGAKRWTTARPSCMTLFWMNSDPPSHGLAPRSATRPWRMRSPVPSRGWTISCDLLGLGDVAARPLLHCCGERLPRCGSTWQMWAILAV
mmetsp:Transcript_23178/g.64758  ORF Transcript_23178/g.64758 Transcript_23178/m.64758 type:complete len:220 (-) Transcript_23178:533-1192(-)